LFKGIYTFNTERKTLRKVCEADFKFTCFNMAQMQGKGIVNAFILTDFLYTKFARYDARVEKFTIKEKA